MKLSTMVTMVEKVTGRKFSGKNFSQAYVTLKALRTSSEEKIIICYWDSTIFDKLVAFSNIVVRLPKEKFQAEREQSIKILLVNDGTSRMGLSPSEAKKNKHFRGLTLIEGLWLIYYYPELLMHHSIDLVNAQYSLECIPTLYSWKEKINLSAICPDVSDAMCGAPFVIQEIPIL